MSEGHDWLPDLSDDGLRRTWTCSRCGVVDFSGVAEPPPDARFKRSLGAWLRHAEGLTCEEIMVYEVHAL